MKDMSELERELKNRFGENRVNEFKVDEGQMPLLTINLELNSPITVLITNGLSDYCMPVPEKEIGKEYNELYFCLPSYWDLNDKENPNMNWVLDWIQRMSKYVIEKNSWFGKGHTIPCGKPFKALSATMRANHFFLNEPMLLKEELAPLTIGEKTIRFLGIIPIFEDEMDFKSGKGTFKLIRKLEGHGVTEKLDDFRGTVLRSKWRLRR